MKIGITSKDYPIVRNILNKIPGAEYVLLKKNDNLFHTLSTAKNLIVRKKIDFDGKYFFYKKKEVDILHLYNDVNYSGKKWVTTFETLVPRFMETKNDHQRDEPQHTVNDKTRKALKQITKKNCLGIVAISNASANIQRELLKNYPDLQLAVQEKLTVLHPGQAIISEVPKNPSEVLNFIFVGTQFHLKGGVEMLEVFEKLKEKYDFKLTIISSFKTDHYVTKVTAKEAQKTKEKVLGTPWIQHFENIPNERVLELIQNSDVGLLPTWSDTYGFSVLEMQACGVPVITTDIRALPEISNEDCGWLIHLPQNRLKQALYHSPEQKEVLKATLKQQLEAILISIFEDKNSILHKSEKSLDRIKKEHDPEVFAQRLKKIYTS